MGAEEQAANRNAEIKKVECVMQLGARAHNSRLAFILIFFVGLSTFLLQSWIDLISWIGTSIIIFSCAYFAKKENDFIRYLNEKYGEVK